MISGASFCLCFICLSVVIFSIKSPSIYDNSNVRLANAPALKQSRVFFDLLFNGLRIFGVIPHKIL